MEFTKDIKFNTHPFANQCITITYNGFLSDSSELSIIYGFDETWKNTTETKMKKTSEGFVATIQLFDFDTFNFCFRNSENVWDNNSNCNYVASILPYANKKVGVLFDKLLTPLEEKKADLFDIDALIEEILQPIVINEPIKESTPLEINSKPIDLGVEVTKVLSQIALDSSTEELVEYSTLDEILSGTIINETPVELFEESSLDNIVSELIESTVVKSNITENVTEEKSLVPTKDSFVISPRELSKFYLFRKRLKLAFYKALVKIPKLIFGSEEQ